MKLHRPLAHAGSSGPIDPAGSPARRGWPRGQINADRTPENDSGYASSTQRVGATEPKQSTVMSLNDHFSTVSTTNARSSAPVQNIC
jgi:hypothetical protein